MWRLRKRFWDGFTVLKYLGNRPASIPVPRPGQPRLTPVSLESRFPGIPIGNVMVADHVPADEASPAKLSLYEIQVALYRLFPPMEEGLPPVDENPQEALRQAYTRVHERCFRRPVMPDEYRDGVNLGELAVASPYACYLGRAAEGGYQWDLRGLGRYERHPGLRSLGLRVSFGMERGRLAAQRIECALGDCRPGEATWVAASELALCAATTHMSLVRHFNWLHLALGGPLAMATRNELPADHPVRRLLWPHVYGTQSGNQIVTKGQMSMGGDFDGIFSFTHRGMCQLFGDSYEDFDLTVADPEQDASDRGVTGSLANPALVNRKAHFAVIARHVTRYLRLYYQSDVQLGGCVFLRAWLESLQRDVPGGVEKLCPTIGFENLTRLLAALIYAVTVEHEILGTGLWDYQMWTRVQPVRVYENGQREPCDVYQRLVNANLILNARRTMLTSDFSYLALDATGARAFRSFGIELRQLQARLEQEPFERWKMYPSLLNANINA